MELGSKIISASDLYVCAHIQSWDKKPQVLAPLVNWDGSKALTAGLTSPEQTGWLRGGGRFQEEGPRWPEEGSRDSEQNECLVLSPEPGPWWCTL